MGLSWESPVTPKAPTLLRHCSNLRSGYLSWNLSWRHSMHPQKHTGRGAGGTRKVQNKPAVPRAERNRRETLGPQNKTHKKQAQKSRGHITREAFQHMRYTTYVHRKTSASYLSKLPCSPCVYHPPLPLNIIQDKVQKSGNLVWPTCGSSLMRRDISKNAQNTA